MFSYAVFKDREDAGEQLALALQKYKGRKGVVMAIPRGGVPVAAIIAKNLGYELDLVLIKKLGYPLNKEFAIGAVSLTGVILNETIPVDPVYVEKETEKIRQKLVERYHKFAGSKEPTETKDKIVILVDDGVATGNTVIAAAKLVRTTHPEKLIIATPVAPPRVLGKLQEAADEVVCLHSPEEFYAVGQFYEDFTQTTDEEVIEILKK